MKKKVLYLHVGWSKTGTSAIQSQVQSQYQDFLDEGVLYPQSLQWPDFSHHPFALSFNTASLGPYRSNLSHEMALDTLKREIQSSGVESVLISSELSPFYFNNVNFRAFAKENFDIVKIIFSVRRQSDILMSLMNQLVKDPNVRYKGSVFQLGMQNISNFNFYQNILLWEKAVGKENIICIPYSKNIVGDFFDALSVPLKKLEHSTVNKSVPNNVLPGIQSFDLKLSNADFNNRVKRLIQIADSIALLEDNNVIIFSADEQREYDRYFTKANSQLSKDFVGSKFPNTDKEYLSISGFHPRSFSEMV